MKKINYSLEMKSDGEPASGFGTDLLNSLLPRDIEGRLIIPSTHIKGIIRENLENIPHDIIPEKVIAELFGKNDKTASLIHMDNAVAAEDADVINITRTAVNEFGTAEDKSLRTCEAVAAGTMFKGTVKVNQNISSAYEDILKLGLLSLFAIGGSRNRGAGSCAVTLENETRKPGDILRSLSKTDLCSVSALEETKEKDIETDESPVMLKLVFEAENPICVPETPIVKNNLIRSGFSIPASAVQGAVLHKINDVSEKAATACLETSLTFHCP